MRNMKSLPLPLVWFVTAHLASLPAHAEPVIVEAESGTFAGIVDRHSCWHNVMLTDAPHSTPSGRGLVDTPNEAGSFIEVEYDAQWSGPHRITARYTHIKPDPRPGELLINGNVVATLNLPQNEALPALNTDSVVIDLPTGRNVIRLRALRDGGLPNMDYIKVAEVREIPAHGLPRIQVLEAEDGNYVGKEDHHSCWNFIAQIEANHSGFTGEGYVDALNEHGSHIEVQFDAAKAGPHTVGIRYVHGKPDTRPAELRVNGIVVAPSLNFTPTTAWTDWTTLTVPVELKAGPNVIRLTALGAEGLANTDHFAFAPLQSTVWHLDNLEAIGGHPLSVAGNPRVIETPAGKAIAFDGIDDALFFEVHPLSGWTQFTVEVIFRPDADGAAEQRFFHMQENESDSRVMFETRLVEGNRWFLDTFIQSGEQKVVNYAQDHLHPVDQWVHAAIVVDGKSFRHFIDGQPELDKPLAYAAQRHGRTSLGVRINKVNWFKGAIRTIRFTPRVLSPDQFLTAAD